MILTILSLLTCSPGVCQPHSNLPSSQTFTPGLLQEERGRGPGQKVLSNQQTSPPLSQPLLWISASTACQVTYTHGPCSSQNPLGGNSPAHIHGQRFRHDNKPSPLSFRIWFCWSFGFAGLGKPHLSHAGKLDFQSGSLVLDSKSRRIFQIGRRTAHLKGKTLPSCLSFSLGLLSKTNHIGHAHYYAGKVFKKRLGTAESELKRGTDSTR